MTISSYSSQASTADCVRFVGSFTSRCSIQSEIPASTDGSTDFTAGISSLTCRSRIAIGASRVVERDLAREQLERHAADRVEVGPRADVLRHRLLGRHVGRACRPCARSR